jgi:cation transport regulator ChaB
MSKQKKPTTAEESVRVHDLLRKHFSEQQVQTFYAEAIIIATIELKPERRDEASMEKIAARVVEIMASHLPN